MPTIRPIPQLTPTLIQNAWCSLQGKETQTQLLLHIREQLNGNGKGGNSSGQESAKEHIKLGPWENDCKTHDNRLQTKEANEETNKDDHSIHNNLVLTVNLFHYESPKGDTSNRSPRGFAHPKCHSRKATPREATVGPYRGPWYTATRSASEIVSLILLSYLEDSPQPTRIITEIGWRISRTKKKAWIPPLLLSRPFLDQNSTVFFVYSLGFHLFRFCLFENEWKQSRPIEIASSS